VLEIKPSTSCCQLHDCIHFKTNISSQIKTLGQIQGTHHEAQKETVDGCGIRHTNVFHETVTLRANSHRRLQFVNWASCQDDKTQTMPPVPAPAQSTSPSDDDKDKTAQASSLEASHVKKSVLE